MSSGWTRSFFNQERYEKTGISFEKPNEVEQIRINHLTTSHIRPYVETLRKLMEEIKPIPELVINYDETWLNPHHHSKTVLVAKSKNVDMDAVVPGEEKEREHITIGVAITARGDMLRLQAILPIQNIPAIWKNPRRAKWDYLFSYGPGGWAIKVFFWLKKCKI